MKKIYRNLPAAPKPRKPTAAQRRREWERTVIAGGMVRASAFPRTAFILNKGRGAMVMVIGVPLRSEKQIEYLQAMAHEGIIGQTPEEVATWFISEGIIRDIKLRGKCKKCGK